MEAVRELGLTNGQPYRLRFLAVAMQGYSLGAWLTKTRCLDPVGVQTREHLLHRRRARRPQ
jgi:hypothetical protein